MCFSRGGKKNRLDAEKRPLETSSWINCKSVDLCVTAFTHCRLLIVCMAESEEKSWSPLKKCGFDFSNVFVLHHLALFVHFLFRFSVLIFNKAPVAHL